MQIKTKNLTHIFEKGGVTEHLALSKVNVDIKQGEYIAVVGQTGSGKTTFIEHLNALVRPTDGEIIITDKEIIKSISELKMLKKAQYKEKRSKNSRKLNEKNIVKIKEIKNKIKQSKFQLKKLKVKKIIKQDGEEYTTERLVNSSKNKIKHVKDIRKKIGIVFQFAEYQLFEETIEKDIIFGPLTMGVPKAEAKELAKEYIKLVGMNESYLKRSPFSLSGGQKRRIALAGILAMEPDVMIFDEPTAGLDPQGEIEMYKIFNKLNKLGKTIIIITHNLDHALENTRRTIMFKDGQVVADGKTDEVLYDKKMLEYNELEVPKLVDLVLKLEAKGKKIGKVTSIKKLVAKL